MSDEHRKVGLLKIAMSNGRRKVGDANANAGCRRVAKKGCVLATRDYKQQMQTAGVEDMGDYQP